MSDQHIVSLAKLNWADLHQMLDTQGYAKLPSLLNAESCACLIQDYEDESLYRKTIDMKRYRFGIGEYKYYHTPLPDQLQQIRDNLYPELAKAANRWLEQLNKSPEYPETLEMFLDQCHQAGQKRPTR